MYEGRGKIKTKGLIDAALELFVRQEIIKGVLYAKEEFIDLFGMSAEEFTMLYNLSNISDKVPPAAYGNYLDLELPEYRNQVFIHKLKTHDLAIYQTGITWSYKLRRHRALSCCN